MNEDILLIRPPSSPQGCTDLSNEHLEINPPLGLSYLAASLIHEGFSVSIIDSFSAHLSIDAVVSEIEQRKPKVVGLTVTSFSLKNLKDLISKAREVTDSAFVVGGPHITYVPVATKQLGADFGLRGDAEFSLVKLMNMLLHGGSENIEGLVNHKGISFSQTIPQIENLDSLIFPDRRLIKNVEMNYGNFTTFITSRGCPFSCIYCGLPNLGSYRKRSVENIIAEMKTLKQHNVKYINMLDDCFSLDKKRTIALSRRMVEERFDFLWQCETRVDKVDYETLEAMRDAGCVDIRFGVESLNERVRREVIGKRVSNEQIYNAIERSKSLGIFTGIYLLIGLPTERVKEIEDTVRGVNEYAPHFMELMMVNPLPGSRLFRVGVECGVFSEDYWESVTNGADPLVYLPEGLTELDLRSFQMEAYHNFYKNGRLGIFSSSTNPTALYFKGNPESDTNEKSEYLKRIIVDQIILNYNDVVNT